MNAVDQLCTRCGLCCDSTLFADVELRAGDNAKRLAKFGLSLAKKGKSKIAFAQPCACFDGALCKIYNDRPKRCRLFECGLLKKVNAGEMKANAALKKISHAKVLANSVRGLLRSLGERPEDMALIECYKQAMQAPIDLNGDARDSERRGELMQAFSDLMLILQRDFLS
jgi:Fe-S-cluster containining protein